MGQNVPMTISVDDSGPVRIVDAQDELVGTCSIRTGSRKSSHTPPCDTRIDRQRSAERAHTADGATAGHRRSAQRPGGDRHACVADPDVAHQQRDRASHRRFCRPRPGTRRERVLGKSLRPRGTCGPPRPATRRVVRGCRSRRGDRAPPCTAVPSTTHHPPTARSPTHRRPRRTHRQATHALNMTPHQSRFTHLSKIGCSLIGSSGRPQPTIHRHIA
jgi:hypothetical protein